ncbi:MAG: hypothetical protein GYA24_17865 [Candidatus Lokiarchaeota archaeon]|nr:hypothetical protein [Candidatus Lokiarchaeota archaeon]
MKTFDPNSKASQMRSLPLLLLVSCSALLLANFITTTTDNVPCPRAMIEPSAAVVYEENFNSYVTGSHPTGWFVHDNPASGMFFDVNDTIIDDGKCLRLVDGQGTDASWGRVQFPGPIPAGSIEFKVRVKAATTGSTIMQHNINVQDLSNVTAFTVEMRQNLTEDYWTIGINGILGTTMNTTQLAEDTTYSVKIVFGRGTVLGVDALIMSLFVNNVLFLANQYAIFRPASSLQVTTTNPSTGSTWFFDTFSVTTALTGNAKPTITSPPDMSIPAGAVGHTITWTITDPDTSNPTFNVYNNGSLLTFVPLTWNSGEAIVFTLPGLAGPQKANITIVATDGINETVKDLVWVTTSENVAPVITGVPSRTIEQYSGANLTWTITDASTGGFISYTIYYNDTHLLTWNTWTSPKVVQYNTSSLVPGTYNVNITAYDGLGKNASYITVVRIVNTPPAIQGQARITIEHGSTENVTWVVTDPSIRGTTYWGIARNGSWVAGQIGAWSSGQSFQVNTTGMAVGSYNFTLVVGDGYQERSCTTIVDIVPDLPPRVSTPGDITYNVGETGHSITWTFTDYNMTTSWFAIFKGDVLLSNTTGWTGPTQSASINVDGLSKGVYTYRIVVSDGKTTSSDAVTITVNDPVVDAIIIAAVIAGVIAIIAAVIAVKRKKKPGAGKAKRKVPARASTGAPVSGSSRSPAGVKVIACPSCGMPFTLTGDYVKQYAGQTFKCTKCQADVPI